MPESATESATAAQKTRSWKIVVHLTHASPELGVLIHQGPKQIKVRRVYGRPWQEILKDEEDHPSQYGEVWYAGSCEILDPICDGGKIAAVEALIVRLEDLRERHMAELRSLVAACHADFVQLFPHRKEA